MSESQGRESLFPHARPDGLLDVDDMDSLRTLGQLTCEHEDTALDPMGGRWCQVCGAVVALPGEKP